MKKIQTFIIAAVVALGLAVTPFATQATYAAVCSDGAGCVTKGLESTGSTGGNKDLGAVFKTIANVLLFIIGAVAVIMLILGGIRYVLSQGDAKQVESAKNTILYAVIGIIVALLAYAIVNFVIGAFATK